MGMLKNKMIKSIFKRDEIKAKAIEKGWRSRKTLLFLAWLGDNEGLHLEWLGFYEEAQAVRNKFGIELKDMGNVIVGGFTAAANSALHEGVYDGLNNTVTYGHIQNKSLFSGVTKMFGSMIYTLKETTQVLFGKYDADAWGLPVTWTKPKNLPARQNTENDSVNE